jgi:rhodanese-related sulfurtransferase
MGPLVPSILSNEFSLVIALIAGIGFGFVLEQAGFSSTKKLVGLFYGYDFTVLKVFFTAGVTAMIGVLLFGQIGILDLSLIYINPTFLWSALVGGAIMGVGFIIGGFCPGTSVCAAAIGKLDGLAFVFGSGLGVLLFAEGYPMFKDIYLSKSWGALLINEQLGLSKVLFAFILAAIAFVAFYLTRQIENKVNRTTVQLPKSRIILYSSAVVFAFLVLTVVALMPDRNSRLEKKALQALQHTDFTPLQVPADKLASEIVSNYYKINIIDLRTSDAFTKYHLPFAINIPVDKLTDRQWRTILDQKHKVNFFYADDQLIAKRGILLAGYLGKAENYLLSGSSSDFKKLFFDLTAPGADASKQEVNNYHFRNKAANDMKILQDALKNSTEPVVAKTSKIKGGC